MKTKILETDGRDLLELLRDLLRTNPEPEKIELYWQEQKPGEAPDMDLAIMIQAAAEDGLSDDSGTTLEAGDGEPDELSNMVFLIPGGLGLIINIRKHEMAEREIAAWIEYELDLEEDTVECHKSKKRFRPTSPQQIAPDLAN